MSTSATLLAWLLIVWVPGSIIIWHLWRRSLERDAEAEEFWAHLEPNRHGGVTPHRHPDQVEDEEVWQQIRRQAKR